MTDDYREKINRFSIFKTKKIREIDFTKKVLILVHRLALDKIRFE